MRGSVSTFMYAKIKITLHKNIHSVLQINKFEEGNMRSSVSCQQRAQIIKRDITQDKD